MLKKKTYKLEEESKKKRSTTCFPCLILLGSAPVSMRKHDRETNMSDIDDKKDAIIQTRSLLLELIAFHSFKSLFPFSPSFFFFLLPSFIFFRQESV